mmetsp:Transcript_16295/g.35982  ORF Transcript_16295/g.35982 Transcript_16295/m.35982 type:complete len:253 (+) Transcript_16295:3-761(+)
MLLTSIVSEIFKLSERRRITQDPWIDVQTLTALFLLGSMDKNSSHPSSRSVLLFASTASFILSWYSSIFALSPGRDAHSDRTARRPAFVAFPIATVATGTPRGICTMLRSESWPLSVDVLIGTPTTGRGVMAATMPGRCAAPPAPAIMTWMPRPAAEREYVMSFSGVRWAETMSTSWGIPNSFRIFTASLIVGRSLWDPMITPTRGFVPIRPSSGITFSSIDSAARSFERGPSSSACESAVTLMCPILRPAR